MLNENTKTSQSPYNENKRIRFAKRFGIRFCKLSKFEILLNKSKMKIKQKIVEVKAFSKPKHPRNDFSHNNKNSQTKLLG